MISFDFNQQNTLKVFATIQNTLKGLRIISKFPLFKIFFVIFIEKQLNS